jgi:amicyanin
VAIIGLAVWGVSLRRTAAGAGTPDASERGNVAPSTANAAPSPPGPGATQASPTAATKGAASVAKVSIDNFAFDPEELVVTAGTTVTWVNADDVPHTATSKMSPPVFDSKTLRTGDKFSYQFKKPGTYDYFCKPHPYMTGKVIVK